MGIDEYIYDQFSGVHEDYLTDEEKAFLIRQYGDQDWRECAGVRSGPIDFTPSILAAGREILSSGGTR